MLRVDVRQLKGESVPIDGTVSPEDETLAGLGLNFVQPVEVGGELQATAGGDFLWRGRIRATVAGECRRCLAPLEVVLDDDVDVLFSPDPELAEDPGVYALPPRAEVVDVAVAVREEIALRVSAFPLCRPDCKGLCATCGADLNAGPCGCTDAGTTS
jgi:uncharacterized protein